MRLQSAARKTENATRRSPIRAFVSGWLLLSFALAASAACGSDAVATEPCRRIEEVRCERAAACGIDLGRVPHELSRTPQNDIDACKRFYRDACLHGLTSQVDPGAPATDACIAALKTGSCSVVLKPGTAPACAFLNQPPPDAGTAVVDAGSDVVADAATD
ncbi:MAG: hypothetical protein U0174_21370 [Polyangiaceae bacterium]